MKMKEQKVNTVKSTLCKPQCTDSVIMTQVAENIILGLNTVNLFV